MALEIISITYYRTTIDNQSGEAYKLLSQFAGVGVNLLAFQAVSTDPGHTQFTLFPDDDVKMTGGAGKGGIILDGPHNALLVKGDDESGALAGIYEKLARAGVNVYASNGIAGIKGSYGVVLYVKKKDYDKALRALDVNA